MFFDDLRSAARSLSRAKVLTAVLLVSLGTGTGANAAVFSVVQALLFRAPEGVQASGRLVSIYTSQYDGSTYGPSSFDDYSAMPPAAGDLEGLAAYDDRANANVAIGDHTQMTRVAMVSGNFFSLLRMTPREGRLPGPTETAAVISSALWESAGSPADVLTRLVTVRGTSYPIVGITPSRFRGLQAGRSTDVWIPLDPAAAGGRGDRRFSLIGRLRPGGDIDTLQQHLATLAETLADQHPATNRGSSTDPEDPRRMTAVSYSPLQPDARAEATVLAWLITATVLLLLAGACVNAGTLLLSRGFARRRDLAVKMALGAPRKRLVRQLVAESLLIAVGSGAVGLLFAHWTLTFIPTLFAPEQAALLDTGLPAGLMIGTLVVAVIAGVLFGIIPALDATSAPAVIALRADSGGITEGGGLGRRLRSALVAAQIALSTVLLMSAVILKGSLDATLSADRDFPADRVVLVSAETPGRFTDQLRGLVFQNTAVQVLRKHEGVKAIGWSSVAPLNTGTLTNFRVRAGTALASDDVAMELHVVTPSYFETMDMEIVEGRGFTDGDGALSTPVAIVDETFARRYFGGVAAGHSLVEADDTSHRIVGVVRVRRFRTMQEAAKPMVFFPLRQRYQAQGHFVVVTHAPAATALDWVTRALRRIDDKIGIQRAVTLEAHLTDVLAIDRMTTTLVGACGVLALLMAMVGVYGVMSDAVQRRTREIGLRVALGAARRQVARLVFSEVAWLAIAGFAAGTALALAAERLLRTAIAAPTSLDIVRLSAAPLMLALVIAVASLVPLLRALRVSAATALRTE